MSTCKPIDTLIAKGEFLKACPMTPEEKQKMSKISYASVVDSLMYIMTYNQPYIVYALGLVSITNLLLPMFSC